MNGRREARRSPLNSAARRRIEAYSAHIRRRLEDKAKLKRSDSELDETGVVAPAEETANSDQGAGPGFLSTARRYIAPSLGKVLGGVASLAVFALAGFALASAISSVKFSDVRGAIAAMSAEQIFAALLFTALSYLALTGYDALALRQLRLRVRYRIAALASFASYAFSFNLGFPVVTAAAVRYWIYARVGVTAVQVANITVIAGVTFWLGMTSFVGFGLMARAGELGAIDKLPAFLNFGLGLAICAGVGYYFVWVSLRPRQVRLRGHFFQLPGLLPTGGQTLLGIADLCCAAAALYALLPRDVDLDFLTFVSVYVFACILGVISHAPGGIGVFEATMLNALPSHSQESLLASLLLFRIIYYFLPFIFALALLGADEGSRRWNSLRETIARILEARE
ncbi:UPF0104 family protein [Methylosinus sporium]|uniref:UPF0104 family protein n=1 Tax=Methylosinus sporium TaxID=428 RepID=A0A549T099_METSR|nr:MULTISPECIES: lysylphosphatidylglycerol synthase domain-containing protein [Methylosinus]MBU3888184.1 flippase-like domain-containing protein [Methylosinus sp. KRF6]TRL35290.1 UPF0104 family protein [Methylosinus sporium]